MEIRAATEIPVAGSEFESGRWAYRNFLINNAFDIIQPDVTTVGGISEWLKIAGMAACFEIPIVPHRAAEIHTQLAGATPNVLMIEHHAPWQGRMVVFDKILKEKLACKEGVIEVSETVGIGLVIDWDAVENFRV
jgi:D-arabinonate dehydratase